MQDLQELAPLELEPPVQALLSISRASTIIGKLGGASGVSPIIGVLWAQHSPGDTSTRDGNQSAHVDLGGDVRSSQIGLTHNQRERAPVAIGTQPVVMKGFHADAHRIRRRATRESSSSTVKT